MVDSIELPLDRRAAQLAVLVEAQARLTGFGPVPSIACRSAASAAASLSCVQSPCIVGGEVRAGFRACLLNSAVGVMVDIGACILAINGVAGAERRRLTYWLAQYVETPPLRNALRGEFD
jgi:hypothetical protein